MSAVDVITMLGVLASLSSVCKKVDVKYEEKENASIYSVKCIDMFMYPSLEATITVYNPELKNVISKIISKMQVRSNAKKK